MKKIHFLPNIITAFGLSCGLFVIFKMTMIDRGEVSPQMLTSIASILLLAAFADLLDGAVARAMKVESEFGGLFDSLADAISFGVGPSVIVLKTISVPPGTKLSFLLSTSAMIFSVCGVLRLVRFNTAHAHEKEADGSKIKNFTGLPIPAAAAAAVSSILFFHSSESNGYFSLGKTTVASILLVQLTVLGYFMISKWKFPSLKSLQVRVASFQLVFGTVVTAVVIIYGILNHFSIAFFLLSWLYVAIAWTLSLIRLISGKNSQTLEDFEPDSDEL